MTVTAAERKTTLDFDPHMLGLEQPMVDKNKTLGEALQFVSFRVDHSEYGINIMAIREIKGWTRATGLPGTPDHVRGVLNLRGVIVPIFDLRCRFGRGLTEVTPLHVVIIVTLHERIMGLLVDAVSDIVSVYSSDILPVPQVENRHEERFLNGLITVQDRMVALLDLNRLFDVQALVNKLAGGNDA